MADYQTILEARIRQLEGKLSVVRDERDKLREAIVMSEKLGWLMIPSAPDMCVIPNCVSCKLNQLLDIALFPAQEEPQQ